MRHSFCTGSSLFVPIRTQKQDLEWERGPTWNFEFGGVSFIKIQFGEAQMQIKKNIKKCLKMGPDGQLTAWTNNNSMIWWVPWDNAGSRNDSPSPSISFNRLIFFCHNSQFSVVVLRDSAFSDLYFLQQKNYPHVFSSAARPRSIRRQPDEDSPYRSQTIKRTRTEFLMVDILVRPTTSRVGHVQ